jgi:hypothetical protein
MGVALNPLIEAAVHGMEAQIIANKETIRTDHFKSEDHVHSVLGQKGFLLVEFSPQGSIINAGVYCDALKKLHRVI